MRITGSHLLTHPEQKFVHAGPAVCRINFQQSGRFKEGKLLDFIKLFLYIFKERLGAFKKKCLI